MTIFPPGTPNFTRAQTTDILLNMSKIFTLPGHTFSGISVGAELKLGIRMLTGLGCAEEAQWQRYVALTHEGKG